MKKKLIIVALIIFLVGVTLFMLADRATAPTSTEPNESSQDRTETDQESERTADQPSFDKSQHGIDEPGSIWWIVNRERPLPDGYIPPNLSVPDVQLRLAASEEQMQFSGQAIPAVEAMFAAANSDGVELVFGSGYRSEELQAQFYNSYVSRDGQAAADQYSARPGTSEHQTGLAFDVTSLSGTCHLEVCFEDLPEGQWVAKNAHRFGFIIRYLKGKEAITGYQYEPWHLRYVGEELANELYQNSLTMEEFFNLAD